MFNFPTSCVEQRSQNRHKPEPAQKISWTSTSKPSQQQLKRDISAAQWLPAFCRRHGQENRSQLTPIPACLSRKRTTLVLDTASCWQPTFSFLQLATEEEVTNFKATKIRASISTGELCLPREASDLYRKGFLLSCSLICPSASHEFGYRRSTKDPSV